MGRFTFFLMGHSDGVPVEMDASTVHDVERLLASARFVRGELIDFPDEYGVCSNRAALIPLSRIQMIIEGE